MIRSLARLHSL